LIAGCSDASRAPIAPGQAIQPVPAATAAGGIGTLTFTVTIPTAGATSSSQRSPAYVSGSAQSIAISVYTVTAGVISGVPASTSNQNLTATSPGCSGSSPNVCSITLSAPVGIDAFGIVLYASTGEAGAVLSQLDPTAATERTIVEGAGNVPFPLILSGVPASLTVSAPATTFHGGVPASVPYTVVAKDASGNVIIGGAPYETAITPSASDTNAFSFSPSTITSPTTAVTLQFNGNDTVAAPTFGANVGAINATPIALAFSPGVLGIACSGGCSGLTNGSSPYTLTVTEPGLTGPVTATASGASCTVDPASPSTASLSSGSGTVNLYPNPVGGTCTVTVTDAYSQSATATTTFNAAGSPTLVSGCLASTLPPDPNGGNLYSFACSSTGVMYGSYYFEPLQSNQNPISFQIAAYANPSEAYLTQFTVGGNRYITSVSIGATYVIYNGQNGPSNIPFTSLVP
jgi:hypothetical protein